MTRLRLFGGWRHCKFAPAVCNRNAKAFHLCHLCRITYFNQKNSVGNQTLNVLPLSTIRPIMRFLLSIFLMVFLPLQSAWAVAAPYCGHENSALVSHFGHHAHEHQATDFAVGSSQDMLDVAASGGVDVDCTPCNGVGSGIVISLSPAVFFMGKTHYATGASSESPLPPLQRPERPKWPRLA